MSRILLVDGTQDDRKTISACMGKEHDLTFASNLAEARASLNKNEFDLLLLEVPFSDGDGFQFCASLQQGDFQSLPFIFVTSRSELSDLVMGFSLGAEDYIAKPFDPRALRVRVEARLRKLTQRRLRELLVQVGDIKINVSLQRAWVVNSSGEHALELTPLEFKLLYYFAQHEEHVFTREQLLAAIWTDHVNVLDRTVDMHVSNLRKKLAASRWTLRSVHGVGYRLTPELNIQ